MKGQLFPALQKRGKEFVHGSRATLCGTDVWCTALPVRDRSSLDRLSTCRVVLVGVLEIRPTTGLDMMPPSSFSLHITATAYARAYLVPLTASGT